MRRGVIDGARASGYRSRTMHDSWFYRGPAD